MTPEQQAVVDRIMDLAYEYRRARWPSGPAANILRTAIEELAQQAAEAREWAERLACDLHWLTIGGEFSHWLETKSPPMCMAAAREWEEARDSLRAFNKARHGKRDCSDRSTE